MFSYNKNIAVIDTEGKNNDIYAIVINDFRRYLVYSKYGIDEKDIEQFTLRNDLDIRFEAGKFTDLVRYITGNYILIGYNIVYDLRLLVNTFYYLYPAFAEFDAIDVYHTLLKATGESMKLWEFAYKYLNMKTYRAYGKFEKMERWKKCILDVYFTTKAFDMFKDYAEVEHFKIANPYFIQTYMNA